MFPMHDWLSGMSVVDAHGTAGLPEAHACAAEPAAGSNLNPSTELEPEPLAPAAAVPGGEPFEQDARAQHSYKDGHSLPPPRHSERVWIASCRAIKQGAPHRVPQKVPPSRSSEKPF